MEFKLLKTINRLETFNIDDLTMITDFEEENIQQQLDIFEKQKKIRKISEETYSIIEELAKPPTKCKENIKKIIKEQKIPEFTAEELEIYNKAPDWAKKQADKYLKILKLTQGLTGKRLRGGCENMVVLQKLQTKNILLKIQEIK